MNINLEKKKIAIIGTNGLPGKYGGWDQLLNHLTADLNCVYSISVYTSSYDAVDGIREFNGAVLPIIPLRANGPQSVPYDIISMFHAILCKNDLLLVLGTSGCIFFPILKFLNVKVILNPDGAEWRRGKWNIFVKKFLEFSEYLGIKYASSVVADNLVIQKYLEDRYNIKSFLIEYGGDNVEYVQMDVITEKKYSINAGEYAFKVCRIVPENNIDLILEAFSRVNIRLILIGNWNFSDYGKCVRRKYTKFSNLILLDPIYDQKTLDELRGNCRVYVHGHSVGGTNPSLVEAMSLSLCCLVYDVNYNRETTENSAIYFDSVQSLLDKINFIFENNKRAEEVGLTLAAIAKRRYKWSNIIKKYNYVFSELLNQS
jgi:glycosyltransferase involved in cell wall biosynthesis